MSETEHDVAQTVVSASLSCRFTPVWSDVKESSEEACLPPEFSLQKKYHFDDISDDLALNDLSKSSNEEVPNINIDIHSENNENNDETDGQIKVNDLCACTEKSIIVDTALQTFAENSGKVLNTGNGDTEIDYKAQLNVIPSSDRLISTDRINSNLLNYHSSALNVKSTSDSIASSVAKCVFVDVDSVPLCNSAHYRFPSEEGNLIYEIKKSPQTDDYFSGSTDGTLQNSEESSAAEEQLAADLKPDSLKVKKSGKMGNKQAPSSQARSDEDTPDDGKIKCCEIPKKKIKEKGSKPNRASRSDDLLFDSNEVYPFEGRSRSEQEINEPVELEPFEIVETDDIKFVPGAGTSDVIKSVSEPRFTTIAEEPALSEEVENQALAEANTKVPFYIDKGNRLIEPGTATAHSTFEFKQVKPKSKVSKITSEQIQHNYENIGRIDESPAEAKESGRKPSSGSSKSSSNSSSKDVSRKNSKDAIQKPSRKGRNKPSTSTANINVTYQDAKERKPPKEKLQNSQSVRDSEIDRNIDSVLMLTQTMFSNVPDKKEKKEEEDPPQTSPLNQYENINICAKLGPSGITITHKEDKSNVLKKKEREINTETKCSGNDCEEPKDSVKVKNNYPKVSKDIVEISESGTLIIKSLADLPSAEPTGKTSNAQCEENSSSDSLNEDDVHDDTDVKVSYETIDRLSVENRKDTNATSSKNEEKECTIDKEHVPPPSPLAMGALEEEEEDEIEDVDDVDFREENRRKSEILEFTENVCKRLSHLLEVMPNEDEDETATNEAKNSTELERKIYEDHIYETINGSGNTSKTKGYSVDNVPKDEQHVEVNEHVVNSTDGNSLQLSARSESSSTLKRTSGDSEIYNQQQEKQRSSLSDDELPDFFDPREIPPPKLDSEIFCSEMESHSDDCFQSKDMQTKTVFVTGKPNKLNYDGQYDNIVLENDDKNLSLPIQSFETDLINNTPSPSVTEELQDITPTAEAQPKLTALTELAKAEEETPVQFETSGRQSATESDIDISEHRDDLSTDSMLADDEAEETMEILFTKTYTEPVEGAEVFLSCTVVNSAYKVEQKKSETWLSDEALEYLEANASEVMSTAFLKAKKEMKDIQICLQSLRQQMEHFHSDCDDISLPEIPVDSLSPDYFGMPMRKAVTD